MLKFSSYCIIILASYLILVYKISYIWKYSQVIKVPTYENYSFSSFKNDQVTKNSIEKICEFSKNEESWYLTQLSTENVNLRTQNCQNYFQTTLQMIYNTSQILSLSIRTHCILTEIMLQKNATGAKICKILIKNSQFLPNRMILCENG